MAGNTLNQHVGASFSSTGGVPGYDQTQDEHGAERVIQSGGKYQDATKRQICYAAATTAGRAPGTALSTKAPVILVYNPVGSGKRLKIMKVSIAQAATGTLGAGTLNHIGFTINGPQGSQSNVAPVVGSGAAITPQNMDLGGPNASVATCFELGTLNSNPVSLYPFCELNASVGGTTATQPQQVTEDVDGGIVLEPGSGWGLAGIAAAGSSPLVHAGVVWEEESLAS
jgi:hypothetical protein